jgi:hypothetical protein
MNATIERALIRSLRSLSTEQLAEVQDFVEFLAAKSQRQAAWDRLLAIAPALDAAGVAPLSEDEIEAEIQAARSERRTRARQQPPKDAGAHRS